jgi:hypothetical protein
MGGYIKTSSNSWTSVKRLYVKTSTNTWTSIKSAYVKTSSSTWQKWFSSTTDTPVNTVLPSITASTYANTNIAGQQALLGSTLTGSKGTWTEPYGVGTNSYAYSWLSNGTSTGSTGTTFSTTGYDGQNITFSVTATDTSGTTTAVSNAIEVTKNMPINISVSISLNTGKSTSSPHVGDILSINSSWNTGATYIPDSYSATFIAQSGTYVYTWLAGQTANSNYTIKNSDVGYPISCYVTAFNTGAPIIGVTTATQTTGNVTISLPSNTSLPYWTDTLNNTISAPYYVGSTYRLHFGTWSNNPTYYEYEVSLNNPGGTILQQDVSGSYSSNYVDVTFSSGTTYTIGALVYAGNFGGLSDPASAPSIGPITYQTPTVNSYPTISGTGQVNTHLYYNPGSYNNASSVRTDLVPSTNIANFSGSINAESTASVTLLSTVNTSPLPGNGALQYTVVVPSAVGIVAGITQVSGGYISSGTYVSSISGNTLTLNQHTGYTTNGGPVSSVLTFTNAYYTITSNDASSPAFNYATRDTVVGLNGNTYYYWSGGFSSTGSNTVSIPNGSGSILSYIPVFTINSYPTISGSGVYGNTVTGTSGLYTAGTVQSATLIYLYSANSSNSYSSVTPGYSSTSHAWTTSDPAGNPTHVVMRDTVLGVDGVTYYVFSGGTYTTGTNSTTITDGAGAIKSLFASLTTNPYYNSATSTTGGWTATIANTPNPSGGSYTFSSASVGSASVNSSNGTITASGLTSQQNSTVYVIYSVPGYNSYTFSQSGTSALVHIIPTINMSANTNVTSSSGTINWTSTNQSSYSSNNSFFGTGTTDTSISKTGLLPSTNYTGTVTVTSSTGDTAFANYSLTTTAPAAHISKVVTTYKTTAPYASFAITSTNATSFTYTVHYGSTPSATSTLPGTTTSSTINVSSGGSGYYYYIIITANPSGNTVQTTTVHATGTGTQTDNF